MDYRNIKNDRQWRATTGLGKLQFEILVKAFTVAYNRYFQKSFEDRREDTPNEARFRTPDDLLFFLLFTLKTGLPQDALALVFNLDGSNVNRNKKVALRVLQIALTDLGAMPKREFKSVEEFEEYLKEHEKLIIDATEQRIQRPENQEFQKDCKKKKKNAIL